MNKERFFEYIPPGAFNSTQSSYYNATFPIDMSGGRVENTNANDRPANFS